jgi:hypothetical protein
LIRKYQHHHLSYRHRLCRNLFHNRSFLLTEYVGDFGYSHGMQLTSLYPGRRNAIDGYLVFEVPVSLTPENAYADIAFNGNIVEFWKLV